MAEIKTRPTAVAVVDFIDAAEPAQRREDARTLCAMLERITGEAPRMWGVVLLRAPSHNPLTLSLSKGMGNDPSTSSG